MKPLFFFFLFVLLVPPSSAFDCDYFSDYQKEECMALQNTNESLIANLVYTYYDISNHEFVYNYNKNVAVNDAPSDTEKKSNNVIKNAWISLLYIYPSVKYENKIYVPNNIESKIEYNYEIEVPDNYYNSRKSNGRTCEIKYSLDSTNENLINSVNNQNCNSKECDFSINNNSSISSELEITAKIKEKHYKWYRYCCSRGRNGCNRYCYKCKYSNTKYQNYNLKVDDTLDLFYYDHNPNPTLEVFRAPYDSYKAELNKDNETNVIISFNNSFYSENEYVYSAEFIKQPFNLLQIKADKQESSEIKNLIKNENNLYVKDKSFCNIQYNDFFKNEEKMCFFDLTKEPEIKEFEKVEFSDSWNLLFKVVVFLFVNFLIYLGIKKSWGKALIPFCVLFLFIPFVHAEECGLTNLASCIPEKMYDFTIDLINSPLEPLLDFTRSLIESAPSIELFEEVWRIIVYCISMFYGLLFIYSGFQFMFSGHNVIRREMAKDWLKNTVIMITLVQGSFYLYQLIVELGSIMATSVLSLVNEHFFMITADNIINIGLEFLFTSSYLIVLFITIILLMIRYLIVCFGVLFFPIGIFCYFIPPLKSYGKLILYLLTMFIFVTFIDAIIILACSMLIEVPFFENMKILVMICCFSIVNFTYFILIKHAISKSSFSDSGEKVAQAVKYIAMFV